MLFYMHLREADLWWFSKRSISKAVRRLAAGGHYSIQAPGQCHLATLCSYMYTFALLPAWPQGQLPGDNLTVMHPFARDVEVSFQKGMEKISVSKNYYSRFWAGSELGCK